MCYTCNIKIIKKYYTKLIICTGYNIYEKGQASRSCREDCKLDCLQSVFSLKIPLVLISSSTIANHDFIITIETR